jgi:hypothetical protein
MGFVQSPVVSYAGDLGVIAKGIQLLEILPVKL